LTDTENEINLVIAKAREAGAFDAVLSTHWEHGGPGAANLAKATMLACKSPETKFTFTYELTVPI